MYEINWGDFDDYIKKKKENPEYYLDLDLNSVYSPLVVLTGCNGSGKTQTLKKIAKEYKKNGTQYVYYSTSHDGQVTTYVNPWNRDTKSYMEGMMTAFRSEGERMHDLFGLWCENTFFPALHKNNEPIKVLIDEADSGLSLDRLYFSLVGLTRTIIPMELKKRDIKIFITANSYEMLEVLNSDLTKIIWMPTGGEWKPKSYEEFVKPYKYYYNKMWAEK